jgi:propionyl-CoA synthetase
VALAASMKHIFCGKPGETYFSTSDIGWVVGHSYIIYGPLIAGMATIMYEGLPIRPDAAIWWSLVEKYKVSVMFSAPTAVRVLKKQDPAALSKYDLSSLRRCSWPASRWTSPPPAGSPRAWASPSSTTTGRPRPAGPSWPSATAWKAPTKFGSPGKAVYGYDVKLIDETTGERSLTGANQKGVVAIEGPLPPGCMQTVWRDDARFVNTYWKSIPASWMYSTFDWGIRTPTATSSSWAAPTT